MADGEKMPAKASGNDLLDTLRGIRWRLTALLVVAVLILLFLTQSQPWRVHVTALPR